MPTWTIVFKGDAPGKLRTKKQEYDAAQFDAIAKANEFDGHEVIGMWAIDHETEQEERRDHPEQSHLPGFEPRVEFRVEREYSQFRNVMTACP